MQQILRESIIRKNSTNKKLFANLLSNSVQIFQNIMKSGTSASHYCIKMHFCHQFSWTKTSIKKCKEKLLRKISEDFLVVGEYAANCRNCTWRHLKKDSTNKKLLTNLHTNSAQILTKKLRRLSSLQQKIHLTALHLPAIVFIATIFTIDIIMKTRHHQTKLNSTNLSSN